MIRKRRSWVAALVTLFQPGLGHLYAGAPVRGMAVFLIASLTPLLWGAGLVLTTAKPTFAAVITLLFLGITVVLAVDAARTARRQPAEFVLRPYNRGYVYAGWVLVMGILLGAVPQELTKKHFLEAFRIASGSMEPAVEIGDLIFVQKWRPTANLRQGSIVVFQSIEEPELKVIGRLVALPRDTVAMKAGRLYRNGIAVNEGYVIHQDPTRHEDPVQRAKMRQWQVSYLLGSNPSNYSPDLQDWGPVLVPADSVMVLGDNRDHSYDSRYYGFIPQQSVIGRPMFVYYSYDPRGARRLPAVSAPRWDRVGLSLADSVAQP